MQFSPIPPHLRASLNLTHSEIHQKAARAPRNGRAYFTQACFSCCIFTLVTVVSVFIFTRVHRIVFVRSLYPDTTNLIQNAFF